MKKAISVLLFLMMTVLLYAEASAASTTETGKYGSGGGFVTYKKTIYDDGSGSVTITGYEGTITTLGIPPTIDNVPVKSIKEYAFRNNTSITSLEIAGPYMETIGQEAFSGCTNLEAATLPTSLRFLRSNAFSKCSSLTEITLPNSLEALEISAFTAARRLKVYSCPPVLKPSGGMHLRTAPASRIFVSILPT